MKLYTEEQVIKGLTTKNNIIPINLFLEKMVPIELPGEEEIVEEAESISKGYKALGLYNEDYNDGFTEGAKWVIEQIKQEDNDKI